MSYARANNTGASDCLQVYLGEIKHESLLTAADECRLSEAIARGDSDARTRMIQANLRLVVKIARDFAGRGMVLEDLIGEGNLGLIRAAKDFEPRFGTRFSTYASYWIKQSIRHALINTTSTIRLPAHMVGLLTKWRRAERAICREKGRAPSFSEVASFLGLSETQKSLVGKAQQARQLKLESTVTAESGPWSPAGCIERYDAPDALLEADDERRILMNRLDRLDHRERTVLALRYGLEGELPLTLKEIGRRLGVTREWVRKIELRAVRKLDDEQGGEKAESSRTWTASRLSRRSRSVSSDHAKGAGSPASPGGPRPDRRIRPRLVPEGSLQHPLSR
jgi:RNA polymerase primary sigma factor